MTRNEGSIRGVKDVNLNPLLKAREVNNMAVAERTVITEEGSRW